MAKYEPGESANPIIDEDAEERGTENDGERREEERGTMNPTTHYYASRFNAGLDRTTQGTPDEIRSFMKVYIGKQMHSRMQRIRDLKKMVSAEREKIHAQDRLYRTYKKELCHRKYLVGLNDRTMKMFPYTCYGFTYITENPDSHCDLEFLMAYSCILSLLLDVQHVRFPETANAEISWIADMFEYIKSPRLMMLMEVACLDLYETLDREDQVEKFSSFLEARDVLSQFLSNTVHDHGSPNQWIHISKSQYGDKRCSCSSFRPYREDEEGLMRYLDEKLITVSLEEWHERRLDKDWLPLLFEIFSGTPDALKVFLYPKMWGDTMCSKFIPETFINAEGHQIISREDFENGIWIDKQGAKMRYKTWDRFVRRSRLERLIRWNDLFEDLREYCPECAPMHEMKKKKLQSYTTSKGYDFLEEPLNDLVFAKSVLLCPRCLFTTANFFENNLPSAIRLEMVNKYKVEDRLFLLGLRNKISVPEEVYDREIKMRNAKTVKLPSLSRDLPAIPQSPTSANPWVLCRPCRKRKSRIAHGYAYGPDSDDEEDDNYSINSINTPPLYVPPVETDGSQPME